MANEILGKCRCPICERDGANVLMGATGKCYINCDMCVSLLRSMSRDGSDKMRAMIITKAAPVPAPEPAPAPKPEKKPEPAPAAGEKKKRGLFGDAVSALAGGD